MPYADARRRDLLLTLLHLAVMAAKLRSPGGVRAVIAENLLLKQQLIAHVPLSHTFVERLIGTMRREFLDDVLFWNAARSHASLNGRTPLTFAAGQAVASTDLSRERCVSHCHGLVQLSVAA